MKIVLVVLLLLVAVTVTGALVAGPQLREKLASLKPKPPTTTVRIEEAASGTLIETVSAPGEIEPHTKVDIAAVVSARVLELPFREGDVVRKDDVIGRLDDRDLRSLLTSARARRDGEDFRMQAEQRRASGVAGNMAFAKTELERMQKLYETGDISRRELDSAQERYNDLQTSLEAAKHSISVIESSLHAADAEIDRAQEGLNNTVITAPMDGVITLLNVEVGEIVTGSTTNPGTVLMTIADLSRMLLKAQVAESDIAEVAVGQKAKIYINAYPDDIYSGTVRHIALQRSGAADGTGFFETEVEIDLRGRRILSGLVANVDVEIKAHEGIKVPYQAIVTRETEELPSEVRDDPLVDKTKKKTYVVYKVVDGKSVCTPVVPGESDLTHRIIKEGIEAGDEIIVGPYKVLESIKHDTAVEDEGASDDEKADGGEEKSGDATGSGDEKADPDAEKTDPADAGADAE